MIFKRYRECLPSLLSTLLYVKSNHHGKSCVNGSVGTVVIQKNIFITFMSFLHEVIGISETQLPKSSLLDIDCIHEL